MKPQQQQHGIEVKVRVPTRHVQITLYNWTDWSVPLEELVEEKDYWYRPIVKCDVLRALVDYPRRSEVIPILESACRDEDGLVRATACYLLGELGSRASLPLLIEALQDRFTEVVRSAIKSIAQLEPDAVGLLTLMLEHPMESVRGSACDALRMLADQVQDARLRQVVAGRLAETALHDTDIYIRIKACVALEDWRDPQSIQVLEQVAREDENELVRNVAQSVLKSFRAGLSQPTL